jgi:hypothetical protein
MIVSEKNIIPYRDTTSNLIGFKNPNGEIVVEAKFDKILSWGRPTWHFDEYEHIVVCSTPDGEKHILHYGYVRKENSISTIKTCDGSLCVFKKVNEDEVLVKEFKAEDGYDCNNYKRTRNGYLVVSLYTNDGEVYEIYNEDLVCVCGKDEPINEYDIIINRFDIDNVVAYCKKTQYKYVIFNGHTIKVLKSCDFSQEDAIIVLANKSGKVSFVDYYTGKVLLEDNIPELKDKKKKDKDKDKNERTFPRMALLEFDGYYNAIRLEQNIYVYNILDQKFTKLKFKAINFVKVAQDVIMLELEKDKKVLYKASLDKYSDEYETLSLVNDRQEAIVKNNGKSYLLGLDTLNRDSEEYDEINYRNDDSESYIYVTLLDGKVGAICKFTNEVLLNNVYTKVSRCDVGKPEYNQLEYSDGNHTYYGAYNSILKKIVVPVKYTRVVQGIYNEYIEMAKSEYLDNENKVYKCVYNVENDSCVPVLPPDTYNSIECIGLYLLKVTKDDMVGIFKLDTQEWVFELTPNFIGKFEVDRENNQLKVISGTETKVIAL